MKTLSIIVPIFNEEENILELITRIHTSCISNDITYEVILIDDYSTDTSKQVIKLLAKKYPVIYKKKQQKRGKAYSLLEGFSYASYDLICIIDGDLQYPPEAIPQMLDVLEESQAGVVVAQRLYQKGVMKRKILSTLQVLIFNRWLHQITVDVQSGLKVFRKEIIERIELHPTPWTFDLEFLLKAKNSGYKIQSVPISFVKRQKGSSKVSLIKTAWEIALHAVLLKFSTNAVVPFHPKVAFQKGKGFHYKGKPYIHHSSLPVSTTAFFRLTRLQKLYVFLLICSIILGLEFNWHATIVTILGALTFFYFSDLVLQLILITKNFQQEPELTVAMKDVKKRKVWPLYTIFCPLYKEASVVPQFTSAIQQLDYPKDKLQVILLLEEDDQETIEQVKKIDLPSYFELLVVPHSYPKTKPKALNFGLSYAKGEYVVVYDAEDIPDPMQLKKVITAFETNLPYIVCIQAKLNFYNPNQNLLTKIFTAEYSLWFDLVLTGLQAINAPIPLGGTSNHFRTQELIRLQGWDSFNVTEDCDLGIRLAREGYSTAIVDSTTLEEANSNIKNWFTQRGRWIKGYIQTYFVHTRNPKEFLARVHIRNFILFQLVVGGKILSLFINPFMWLITFMYFAFRAKVGLFIESFFPPEIFYIGILSLVIGNFLYMYYYMIATVKRKHYELTKYALLVPLYWLCMSISAWQAVYKMIVSPHYWAKTTHGFHLKQKNTPKPSEKISGRLSALIAKIHPAV